MNLRLLCSLQPGLALWYEDKKEATILSWKAIKSAVGQPFGDSDLPFVEAGPALVYLMRRFGYPSVGSDSTKEVCDYTLPTGQEGTYLVIHIGGAKAQIGLTIDSKIDSALCAQTLAESKPLRVEETDLGRACIEAVADTLRDLSRPVQVRDVWINLLGKVSPADLNWEEENDECENAASPWHAAGYGVPEGCYDAPEVFIDFISFVRNIGEGNLTQGMRQLMDGTP